MPMFPDSGVPASEARNSVDVNTPAGCAELWYSTARCQPRFDPAAANAMLAEDMNLIMRGEMQYDCARLDHIERAVRYIDQRGLPKYAILGNSSTNYYEASLDPVATRINDGMVLCVVAPAANSGACYLNVSGLGYFQILRNDRTSMQAGDFPVWVPTLVAFFSGYWFMVGTGVVKSQIPLPGPIMLTGNIDAWVRPDGNDFTGDGTANDPSKAFRTVDGCWRQLGARYIASPIYAINIRLGIPGDYEAFSFTGYGGRVAVIGDPNNRSVYRINIGPASGGNASCVWANGMSSFELNGLCFVLHTYAIGSGVGMHSIIASAANVTVANCDWEAHINHGGSALVWARGSSNVQWFGICNARGNGVQTGALARITNSQWGPASAAPSQLNFSNWQIGESGWQMASLAVGSMDGTTITQTGCIGVRGIVNGNSVLSTGGQILPGDSPVQVGSGGQYFP